MIVYVLDYLDNKRSVLLQFSVTMGKDLSSLIDIIMAISEN